MKVVILGGTSAIATETAKLYAAKKAEIVLVGRNEDRLVVIANDLVVRGAVLVKTLVADLGDSGDKEAGLNHARELIGGVDLILLAYGTLGNQPEAEQDEKVAAEILAVNFTSAAQWCLAAANLLESQGHGNLVVIGSVAGDRGRRANFVYGAAKAGLETLVEGLSHRFANKGPRVGLVKPGPTITPMTEGMERGGLLWATPEQIAKVVERCGRKGGIHYAPWFWRYIMLIIRNLPSAIFNRMDI